MSACGSEPATKPCGGPFVEQAGACVPKLDACGESGIATAAGCVAVGVPVDGCAEGFVHNGSGGCAATLPTEPCPSGQMAIPGEATCRAIAPCRDGRFGDANVAAGTIFVDAASTAATPDGSLERPWPSVQRALDAAPEGATIAIAPGKYREAIHVRKKLVLHGACPNTVEISGATGEFAAVDVTAAAELHEIAVTSPGFGVVVTNTSGVVLDRLWVHDTRVGGVYVANGGKTGASAHLVDSLVERATGAGATAGSGELIVERSAIRDTRADSRADWGYGIRSELFGPPDNPVEIPANVVVRRSLIERNKTGGAIAQGSFLTIDGSVVRDVAARPKDGRGGEGVIGLTFRMPPSIVVTRSVIARTRTAGIALYGGTLELDGATIEDIEVNEAGELGFGILARPSGADQPLMAATSTLRASLVRRTRTVGVLAYGGTATFANILVLDVAPRADGAFGDGIGVGGFPTPDGTVVEATATATRVAVRRAARAGLVLAGATLSLANAQLTCNRIDLDVEATLGGGIAHAFSLSDDGENWCGCEGAVRCRAQSSALEPVPLSR